MSESNNMPDSKISFLVWLLIFGVWIISGMLALVWNWLVIIGGAIILLLVAYHFGRWAGEESDGDVDSNRG